MYSQYHLQSHSQPQISPPQGQSQASAYSQFRPLQNASVPSSPVSPRSSSHHQAPATDFIGRAIHFSTGQFAGQTIRMELHEIQKADLGRKYARVDRRPLDPPPVVHLKLFRVQNSGTERETEKEMNYDDVQVLGLLCTVDLFPVPGPDSLPVQPSPGHQRKPTSAPPTQASFFGSTPTITSSPSPSSSSTYSAEAHSRYSYGQGQSHPYPPQGLGKGYYPGHSPGSPSASSASPSGPASPVRTQPSHFSGYILPSQASPDIVHHLDEYPITEGSKQTQALVGATFVQPAVVDYQGSKAIVFVFADLAVKIEGTFILRYRVFDIFSRPYNQENDLAITAESYGRTFRVYSTKEFPGLAASTELTKHLARWGVRLNIRETERRRRKRPESGRRSPTSDDDG